MIVTVTANTTLDLALFVPSFPQNRTIRARQAVTSMGGKPTDASFILGELGIPSLALGFAAGHVGQKVEAMLRARGVTTDFVQVDGETRICVVIVVEGEQADDERWQTTITTTMMEVRPPHQDELRARYLRALDQASVVVLGGTLPRGMTPDFYIDYLTLAHERGIPTIFDAAEPNLSAGLSAHPTYIKPNRHELEGLTSRPVVTLEDAYAAGRAVQDQYGTSLIITLGGDGALALLPDRAYRIPPLRIPVISESGAGDAVLAGLAASLWRGQPIEEGLRLGFAAAAATVIQPGTADPHREDVERFLPQIELIPYTI